jgi:hypothetical protein
MCAHRAIVRIENKILMNLPLRRPPRRLTRETDYAGETNDRGSIDTIELEPMAKQEATR